MQNSWNSHKLPVSIKSHHYGADLSREIRELFERDDEECLASFYYIDPEHAWSPKVDAKQPETSKTEEKFTQLSERYRADEDVKQFLLENPFLFQPLFQAVLPIEEIFGKSVSLRIEVFVEGISSQLYVLISTSLDPEIALGKLALFDQNWWFGIPNEIHDFLEFTVEFC